MVVKKLATRKENWVFLKIPNFPFRVVSVYSHKPLTVKGKIQNKRFALYQRLLGRFANRSAP